MLGLLGREGLAALGEIPPLRVCAAAFAGSRVDAGTRRRQGRELPHRASPPPGLHTPTPPGPRGPHRGCTPPHAAAGAARPHAVRRHAWVRKRRRRVRKSAATPCAVALGREGLTDERKPKSGIYTNRTDMGWIGLYGPLWAWIFSEADPIR